MALRWGDSVRVLRSSFVKYVKRREEERGREGAVEGGRSRSRSRSRRRRREVEQGGGVGEREEQGSDK